MPGRDHPRPGSVLRQPPEIRLVLTRTTARPDCCILGLLVLQYSSVRSMHAAPHPQPSCGTVVLVLRAHFCDFMRGVPERLNRLSGSVYVYKVEYS
eukprot:COSAG02_NODE_17507_length_998_cov_17.466073_1_plen_96_part_00